MNKLKIILIVLVLTFISCKENIESMLEVDYTVIELNYGFDNYLKNIKQKSQTFIIKERNILQIRVNENGECKIEGKVINDSLIIKELKKYLTPSPENKEMPTTVEKVFTYSGKVIMNKQLIISALYHKDLNYKKYSEIRNKIYFAYNETKNEFAIENFGKGLNELMLSTEETDILKWNELAKIIPVKYTEIINK